MRFLLCFLLPLFFSGCVQKDSDADLFSEGKTRVSLSADPLSGYEPLDVSFEAYLENRERVLTKEITEVKWVIRGPNKFFREIEQESSNYQEGESNEQDAFYLDFTFRRHGRYSVKLLLNDGQYISNPRMVRVQQKETQHIRQRRY